ncbi:MAG: HI0074 family nucleotidyltransferase substrate-binding subunit [Thermoanaerobaculia bacterium]
MRIDTFRQAVEGFADLLALDISVFDAKVQDGLKNGQVQKFEYSTELAWKTIKKFLFVLDGIDAGTPKSAIKEFYLAGYVREADYETLLAMIEDRNRLSHVYRAEEFEKIHGQLKRHTEVMKKVAGVLEEALGKSA